MPTLGINVERRRLGSAVEGSTFGQKLASFNIGRQLRAALVTNPPVRRMQKNRNNGKLTTCSLGVRLADSSVRFTS
jgi:hypothetical protein